MKRRGKLYIGLAGLAAIGLIWFGQVETSAAACANISTFGAVTLHAPELSNIQNQSVWVRMQGQTGSKILVEINGNECHEITLQDGQSDAWVWQSFTSNNQPYLITFPEPVGNKVKLIGISDGIRVDRVLITEPSCTPQDFGNNCKSGVSLTAGEENQSITVPSPAGSVSGKIHVSPTVQTEADHVVSVTYNVNGKTVQQSSSADPFDTTLLENGRYTVYITTNLKDGRTIHEMVEVDIKNPENALTPLVRWIKQYRTSLRIIGLSLLVIAAGIIVLRFIFAKRRSRRERTFRGL